MVQTSADAAKDVSYARGLFMGVNNVERGFPYPKCSEEEKEILQALADPVRIVHVTSVPCGNMYTVGEPLLLRKGRLS